MLAQNTQDSQKNTQKPISAPIGFDNQKYLEEQSKFILERVEKTKDKLYLDETISLNKVADLLSVTTHQLSEFLNNNLKLNFNSFINKYRIEEAKRLLKERPEETIISVAFTVGFNHRSSFNAAFLTYTGLTPKEYRKSLS